MSVTKGSQDGKMGKNLECFKIVILKILLFVMISTVNVFILKETEFDNYTYTFFPFFYYWGLTFKFKGLE